MLNKLNGILLLPLSNFRSRLCTKRRVRLDRCRGGGRSSWLVCSTRGYRAKGEQVFLKEKHILLRTEKHVEESVLLVVSRSRCLGPHHWLRRLFWYWCCSCCLRLSRVLLQKKVC